MRIKNYIGKQKFTCIICGKEFVDFISNKRKYCSRNCYDRSPKRGTRPRNRIIKKCSYCSKEFERPASNFKTYVKHHFCSHQCSSDWWAVNGLHGEEHPNWMGGYSPIAYRTEWEKIKKIIKIRAKNKCEICGGTHKCMDVHHLIPIRTGIDIKIINHLDNLQYLCRPCHIEADRKLRGKDVTAFYDSQNVPQLH